MTNHGNLHARSINQIPKILHFLQNPDRHFDPKIDKSSKKAPKLNNRNIKRNSCRSPEVTPNNNKEPPFHERER